MSQIGKEISQFAQIPTEVVNADILHIKRNSDGIDFKIPVETLAKEKVLVNSIHSSFQLVNNSSTVNDFIFTVDNGNIDTTDLDGKEFTLTAPFTNTASGTLTIDGVSFDRKTMNKGVLSDVKVGGIIAGQIYRVYIRGTNAVFVSGSGGGVSTSYNATVVNGVSTTSITLTNADTDIDQITDFKNGVGIDITLDDDILFPADLTLANSNATNVPLYWLDSVNDIATPIGNTVDELGNKGATYKITYTTGRAEADPMFIVNSLSIEGGFLNVESFQSYNASTVGNLITVANNGNVIITQYEHLQGGVFRADATITGDVSLQVFGLGVKQLVRSGDIPFGVGETSTEVGKLYAFRYDAVIDKMILSNNQFTHIVSTPAMLEGTNDVDTATAFKVHSILEGVRLQTITASNQASVSFTGLNLAPYSGYRQYLVYITHLVVQNNLAQLQMLLSQGGVFQTAGYSYILNGLSADNRALQLRSTTGTLLPFTHIGNNEALSNLPERSLSCLVRISNIASTSRLKTVKADIEYITARVGVVDIMPATLVGTLNSTTAVDGIRFLLDTGNIVSGTFTLIGIK